MKFKKTHAFDSMNDDKYGESVSISGEDAVVGKRGARGEKRRCLCI